MANELGPRVLLGNLGPIMRLGMNRVLSEEGCQVVGHEDRPSAIIGAAHRLRPDVVVLDLDTRLVAAPIVERLRGELSGQQHFHE